MGCAQTSAPPPAQGAPGVPPPVPELVDDEEFDADALPPVPPTPPPLEALDVDAPPPVPPLEALDDEEVVLDDVLALDEALVVLDVALVVLDEAAPTPELVEPPCPTGPFEVPQAAMTMATEAEIIAVCFMAMDLVLGRGGQPVIPYHAELPASTGTARPWSSRAPRWATDRIGVSAGDAKCDARRGPPFPPLTSARAPPDRVPR